MKVYTEQEFLTLQESALKNLTVLISQHRSGGAFLIPMGWSNEKKIETFKRIE